MSENSEETPEKDKEDILPPDVYEKSLRYNDADESWPASAFVNNEDEVEALLNAEVDAEEESEEPPTITLRPAVLWRCGSCQRMQVSSLLAATPEDYEKDPEKVVLGNEILPPVFHNLGMPDVEHAVAPEALVCKRCGAAFLL